jgi:hypothetical protein
MTPKADRTVYTAPEQHMCETWTADGPVGSMWRCGTCGGMWRRHSVGLIRAGGWYPMGRVELWWQRRRQPEAFAGRWP